MSFESETETEIRIEEQDLRVLRGILTDRSIGTEFVNIYDHNLFIGDAQRFAKETLNYIKAYRSPPTRRVMLEHNSSDDRFCEIINYVWNSFNDFEFNSNEFKYDLDKIKNRHTQHKLRNLKEIVDGAEDVNYEKRLKDLQKEISQLQQLRTGAKQAFTQQTLREYMPDFKTNFRAKCDNPNLGRGILTGYSYFDYIKNGMQPAEMLIIAGSTGAGKSMLLNNMAVQMWMQGNTLYTQPDSYMQGYNVLYFSLEMPYEACARRTLSRLARVPSYSLRDAKITSEHAKSLKAVDKFIANYPYDFEIVDVPRGLSVEQMEQRFNEATARTRPDVVVVDYLGLMEDHTIEGDDWLKLGYIAGKLHEFARVYNTVMLTAVQLNRANSKGKKDADDEIGIHRIGRSSMILHHANVAIQIQSRKEEHTFSDMIYHIIKNRDGELGSHSLRKDFRTASVLDMDPPYAPPNTDDAIPGLDGEDVSGYLEKIGWYKN